MTEVSRGFEDGGLYIMRTPAIYLLSVCHRIGVRGLGPHKHNDWLSFELCVEGRPVIVDPGTFCYADSTLRRLFRSTAYHNTVVVDGEEQLAIDGPPFGLVRPHGNVRVLQWESSRRRDLLEVEHTGYTRLRSPVVHRRHFELHKDQDQIDIIDTIDGKGEHVLEWYLHLDAGLSCETDGPRAMVRHDAQHLVAIEARDGRTPEVRSGWISRAYNRREEARYVYMRAEGAVLGQPFTLRFSLPAAPSGGS
jgi:uncharacterized heparinase superfamily protein